MLADLATVLDTLAGPRRRHQRDARRLRRHHLGHRQPRRADPGHGRRTSSASPRPSPTTTPCSIRRSSSCPASPGASTRSSPRPAATWAPLSTTSPSSPTSSSTTSTTSRLRCSDLPTVFETLLPVVNQGEWLRVNVLCVTLATGPCPLPDDLRPLRRGVRDEAPPHPVAPGHEPDRHRPAGHHGDRGRGHRACSPTAPSGAGRPLPALRRLHRHRRHEDRRRGPRRRRHRRRRHRHRTDFRRAR